MKTLLRSMLALLAALTLTGQAAAAGNASFEQQVIDLVNDIRLGASLNPLGLDTRLRDAARFHSTDMATTPCFQHNSCDGTDTFDRIFRFYPMAGAGENIAAGFTNPEAVVVAWMGSPGHRANILNPSWLGLGVGYWFETGSPFGHYWTQNFGTLPPAPVPEPSTLLLMAGGMALLLARRRAATAR